MKLFYIASQDLVDAAHRQGHFTRSHYVVLADGSVLIAAEFASDHKESVWSSQSTVTSLPHPHSGIAVGTEVAKKLSELGVAETDTVFSVSEKAAKRYPLLGMRA